MLKEEENEHYSEVVRDYLDKIPNRIYNISNYLICFTVLVFIILSCIIHYPTVVVTNCELVSETQPKPIISRIHGRIEKITIQDSDLVKKDQVLAYIKSTAKHNEVLLLEKELKNIHHSLKNLGDFNYLESNLLSPYRNLGEIQLQYQNFQKTYIETVSLFSNGFYKNQLSILNKEVTQLNKIVNSLQNQKQILEKNIHLQQEKFEIDQTIYNKEIISKYKILEMESDYLNKQLPIKEIQVNLANNLLQIQEKEREILSLKKINIDQKELFNQSLNMLLSAIANWKSIYILTAPIDGTVIFSDVLQNQQKIEENTELMYVLQLDEHYVGKLQIPQHNFGKVTIGQKVYLKFKGYPFQEYGAIQANISSIAKIAKSKNGMFTATVSLAQQNTTTNASILNFRNGMQARAEIITEDIRLIEQIFYSLRKIFNIRE